MLALSWLVGLAMWTAVSGVVLPDLIPPELENVVQLRHTRHGTVMYLTKYAPALPLLSSRAGS